MDFQKVTFALFVLFGIAGFACRLRYDVNQGAINYGKKDDDKTKTKAKKSFSLQLAFGVTSIIFLVMCIIQGVLKTL